MTISPIKAELNAVFATGLAANPAHKALFERLQGLLEEDTMRDVQVAENLETREVIFEVYLDGFCYTLTRTYVQEDEFSVNLSGREQEIARLVAKGLPNKIIAAVLDISPWTVSTHLRRIFAKLNVSTRAEMVAYTLKAGLLGESKRTLPSLILLIGSTLISNCFYA